MALEEEEGRYRLPSRRGKRSIAEEVSRFSLCYALSEHGRAAVAAGRHRSHRGMDVAAIKAGILGGKVNPGDEVEGEALASPFTAIYQPRAYYPAYALGEMRAALRGGEAAPAASPHYLPVSVLPPLPDGWRIAFLYPADREAFDRPDFPSNVRDVLTRAYARMPLLVPPRAGEARGRVRFRAVLKRLERETMSRLAGLGDDHYDIYTTRGFTQFLQLEEAEAEDAPVSLRGSLFAEIELGEEADRDRVTGVLEDVVCRVVAEVFPECERGERQDAGCRLPGTGHQVVSFRRRFFALVYDPVIAVFRAPALVGLYMPWDVAGGLEGPSSLFESLVWRFTGAMEEELGLAVPPQVEVAYDNRLPWARKGGALCGPSFQKVEEEYAFLRPTLRWLRGE